MGVEAPVRSRLEVSDETIHRTGSGTYSPDQTSFHVDGSMRYARAEILISGPTNSVVMIGVKNAEVEYEGVVHTPQGLVHIPLKTLAKRSTWYDAGLTGTDSTLTGATIEVFNIEDAAQMLGRVQAVTNTGRISAQLWIKQFDPVAGFDLSVGKIAHDYFVMSSHFLREVS